MLSNRVPYCRLYIDNLLDSCNRLRKESVVEKVIRSDRCVSMRAFEGYTKRISYPNLYSLPQTLSNEETVSWVVYDSHYENWATLIVHLKGKVQIVYQGHELQSASQKSIKEIISVCHDLIRSLSSEYVISKENIRCPLYHMENKRKKYR